MQNEHKHCRDKECAVTVSLIVEFHLIILELLYKRPCNLISYAHPYIAVYLDVMHLLKHYHVGCHEHGFHIEEAGHVKIEGYMRHVSGGLYAGFIFCRKVYYTVNLLGS